MFSLGTLAMRALRPFAAFHSPAFRGSALGYFGHNWEVYALWAAAPAVLQAILDAEEPTAGSSPALNSPARSAWVSGWSFAVIAVGAVGCVCGGYAAAQPQVGSARLAAAMLAISGTCCLLAPVLLPAPASERGDASAAPLPVPVLLGYLLVWGFAAAGDSPQFSAMNAAAAPAGAVGSALALTTAIGFGISALGLVSTAMLPVTLPWRLAALAPGPAAGLWGMRRLLKTAPTPA